MKHVILGLMIAVALPPQELWAYSTGTPIATDSRIKTFVYNENDVYRLLTHYGYQLNVEFGNKEEIETISVGERTGWQIIPAGNRLFVRAMEDKAHTNMTVVTNRHAYQFDLYSSPPGNQGWDELVYVVRFYYPEDENIQNSSSFTGGGIGSAAPYPPMSMQSPGAMAAPVAYHEPGMNISPSMPSMGMGYSAMQAPMNNAMTYNAMSPMAGSPAFNYNYSFTGEQSILPTQMYDDSQRTYLTFTPGQMLPQLFSITPDRREQPVAANVSGQTLMVQGVYPRLILRFGNSHACIYNEAVRQ